MPYRLRIALATFFLTLSSAVLFLWISGGVGELKWTVIACGLVIILGISAAWILIELIFSVLVRYQNLSKQDKKMVRKFLGCSNTKN